MAHPLQDEIRQLEEQLATHSIRASAEALDRLIADEFVEFGSSGRVYTKPEVVALILAAPSTTTTLIDFRVSAVTTDVALATFRTERSLRSSLWRREGQAWRIVFHQGTVIAET